MAESAGRRIKRSIRSVLSIRFLESGELEKLRQIERISAYLSERLLKSIKTIKHRKAISRLPLMVEI